MYKARLVVSILLFLGTAACSGPSPHTGQAGSGSSTSPTETAIPKPWSIELHRVGTAVNPDGSPLQQHVAVRVSASAATWQDGATGWRPLEANVGALERAVLDVAWDQLVREQAEEAVVGGQRTSFRFQRPSGTIEVTRNELSPALRRVEQELMRAIAGSKAAATPAPGPGRANDLCNGKCADGEKCELFTDPSCPECDVMPTPTCVRPDGTRYNALDQ